MEKTAWRLAIAAWFSGAALIYALHLLVGEVDSRDLRWWLDAGLYVVAFLYFLALGELHDFFLRYLGRRSGKY